MKGKAALKSRRVRRTSLHCNSASVLIFIESHTLHVSLLGLLKSVCACACLRVCVSTGDGIQVGSSNCRGGVLNVDHLAST